VGALRIAPAPEGPFLLSGVVDAEVACSTPVDCCVVLSTSLMGSTRSESLALPE
jgi:hypothetical protein